MFCTVNFESGLTISKEDVFHHWSAPCIEYNKGIRVGGPFDGTMHSVLFFPGDHRKGWKPTKDFLEVNRTFSSKFPEGAVYHWNEEKQEWHYISQMSDDSQDGAKKLLGVFGVKPADPL